MATNQTQYSEQLVFEPPTGNPLTLLINPESLTLQWKKVLNRVRTKTRLVTLFWGEEPVKFSYRGQTGYVYPNFSERSTVVNELVDAARTQIKLLSENLQKYEEELRLGGPYTFGDAVGNRRVVQSLRSQLDQTGAILTSPRTTFLQNLNKSLPSTQILYLSEKFRVLKTLESLYRNHQDPNQKLVKILYRDYTFEGYFESFSFTDDSKNPWNWIYSIDFTILDWKVNPVQQIIQEGEITLFGDSVQISTDEVDIRLTAID